MKALPQWLWFAGWFASMPAVAEPISWFSDAGKTNVESGGAAMAAGFQFELGVFRNGFIPALSNMADWRSNWEVADSTTYHPATQRFAGSMMVDDNDPPFINGAKAWIFGFRDTATASEWVLFRNPGWLWPRSNPMNPPVIEWNAKDATEVVVGSVNTTGSPFLMKSAEVQSYSQWQAHHLAGEPLSGAGDDPDHDGTPNLMEFVFGTPPLSAGEPTAMPVELVSGHLQITVPRRVDRLARVVVEVSDNLANWQSGDSHTQTISDGPVSLVVRDLTALDAAHPKRFVRLKVSLP
jgi:hypothetical protein